LRAQLDALTFNPTARAAAKWTLKALSPDNLLWLRSLPQGPLHPEPAQRGDCRRRRW
jgi:hypothetical protein